MAKEIAYSRISTKLQNLKAAHPQDVSAKLWRETFKDLINGSEAMRLFDVFAGTLMLLEARNSKYLTWSAKANSANWTAAWLQHIFEKYDILSKYGPTVDATGKRVKKLPVTPVVSEEAEVKKAPLKLAFEVPHILDVLDSPKKRLIGFRSSEGEFMQLPDLTTLTDDALDAVITAITKEQERREEERKAAAKKAKQLEILSTIKALVEEEGETLEDIIKLL